MIRILIVDDEFYSREKIKMYLSASKIKETVIRECDDGVNALALCRGEFYPDLVFTDVRMPRMNGVDLAFALREKYPDCIIIFMSGYSDKEYLKSAISVGASSYLEKPFTQKELTEAVEAALEKYQKNRYTIKQTIFYLYHFLISYLIKFLHVFP